MKRGKKRESKDKVTRRTIAGERGRPGVRPAVRTEDKANRNLLILRMFLDGASASQIAKKAGVSERRVYQILEEYGVQYKEQVEGAVVVAG